MANDPIQQKQSKLLGIQAARGAAALLVVLYHASNLIALPQYAGHVGLGGVLGFGHAGVDFFFVLSGFIIFYVHHSDIGMPHRFVRYAWRRLTRIYPSYWLVTAFVVLLMLLKHDAGLTALRLVKSILLIPDTQFPILDVAWTLIHEMLFYCFFAVMIASRRAGIVCAIAALVLIVVANDRFSEPMLKVMADFRNLEFAIGIAAAYITLKLRVPAALYMAIAGTIGFVAAGIAENAGLYGWDSKSSEIAFALTSGAMIVGLAAGERSGTLRVGSIGRFVGAMSYMLYLIHTIAIGFTYRILSTTGLFAAGMPDWCGVVLATTASMVAAAALYLTFEKPVLSYLHKFRFGVVQGAAQT